MAVPLNVFTRRFLVRILAMEILPLPLPAGWRSTAQPLTAYSVDFLQDNSSVRTPRRTSSSVVKNACLLMRYLAMDICEQHRKHLLRHWFYWWVRILLMFSRNVSTCHNIIISRYTVDFKISAFITCNLFVNGHRGSNRWMEKLYNYELHNSYRSSMNDRAINSIRTCGEFEDRARIWAEVLIWGAGDYVEFQESVGRLWWNRSQKYIDSDHRNWIHTAQKSFYFPFHLRLW
jgi:hypothetical protein